MFEFVGNHPYLWMALAAVLVMLVKSELDFRSNKSIHVMPMNAIRLINNNDDALIIDVRESGDFGNGHIKGATSLPLSTLKDKLDGLAQNKDTVVLAYCNSGSSSSRACRLLMQAGYTNVHNIAGGINAWLEAKLPITKK
ncbi:MAG: rhodanese-like domain-containing protein [Gammaproteobacteria bacterium]|nr:rhodanese-like domain-containing protein [Gammaproteobacteria bacterium]